MRCGEAYRREVEEREFAPPTSALIRGRVVHAIAAYGHEKQIAAKAASPDVPKSMVLRESLPTDEEVADLAASRFELEQKEGGCVSPASADDDPSEPEKKRIGRDKDSAIRLSRFQIERVAPYVDPIDVEKKLVVEPPNADIRISGILDLITNEPAKDGGAPRRGIRDYKTKGKAPSEREASESGQLTMYALLDFVKTGTIADVFALDHLVEDSRRFSREPYFVSQETTRTHEDIEVMVERLNNAVEGVQAGVFLANGPGNWYCSPKWCRFWSTCKYVSKARR
jgi:hypothetical protein